MIEQVSEIVTPWSLAGAVASVVGTTTVTVLVVRRRSRTRELAQAQETTAERRRRLSAGTLAAAVAFVICTSVSLNTSYRFTADGLGMTGTDERVLACAGFEALIAMCVLGARERLNSREATPGWYGTAVWAFAVLSSVPAWHEGGGLTAGTVVRIIVGSVGSALSAHAALGLELRHRTKGERESQSPGALIVRELRERLMARLGLIQRGRDAEQIAQDRHMDRAVEYANENDHLTPKKRGTKTGRKLGARLARAMDRAGCADPERRAVFDRRLAMMRDVADLPNIELPSTWTAQPTPEERAAVAQLQSQIDTLGVLAAQVEDRTAHGPAQRAAAEDGQDEHQDTPAGGRTAAYGGTGTPRLTVRVPIGPEDDEDQGQDADEGDPEELDLSKFTTKRAALKALLSRSRIAADDPRSNNQVASELLVKMRAQGIEYDRGAACKAVGEWRTLRVPAQQAQTDTLDRELTHV